MNLKVVRQSADSEKDKYKVVLKGNTDLPNLNCLAEVELSLKAKMEDILEGFEMGSRFTVTLEVNE